MEVKDAGENLSRRFQKLLRYFQPKGESENRKLKDLIPLFQSHETGLLPLPSSLPEKEAWTDIEKELASVMEQASYINDKTIALELDDGLNSDGMDRPADEVVGQARELSQVVNTLANMWNSINSDRKFKEEVEMSLEDLGKRVSRIHLPPDLKVARVARNLDQERKRELEGKLGLF